MAATVIIIIAIPVPVIVISIIPIIPVFTAIAITTSRREDFVDRAMRERHNVKVAVGAGLHISSDTKARTEEQSFAFGDLEFSQVISHTVAQPTILETEVATTAIEVEAE